VARTSQPQQQQQQQQQCQQQQQQAGRSILDAAASVQQQQQKREPQQLLWPGLRKRGRLAALGRAAGSGGNIPLSDPSLHSASEGPSCSVRADSCPTSLLAAAGRLQMLSGSSGGPPGSSAAAAAAAASASAVQGAVEAVTQARSQVAAVGSRAQESGMLTLSQPDMTQPQSAQEQVQEMQQQPVDSPTQAMPPPPAQPAQQQCVPPWQRDAAASIHTDSAPAMSGGRVSESAASVPGRASSSVRRVGPQTGAAFGGSSSAGRSLLIDQRKAMRAMLGVRVVWVSPEQRRGGVATKLLDAAR
jgi:hypothetical protein